MRVISYCGVRFKITVKIRTQYFTFKIDLINAGKTVVMKH